MNFTDRYVEYPNRYAIESTTNGQGETRYLITPDPGKVSGTDGNGGTYAAGTALTAELLTDWTDSIETLVQDNITAIREMLAGGRPMLVGAAYDIDYQQLKAVPFDGSVWCGQKIFLFFDNKHDANAEIGCCFSDFIYPTSDTDPAYGFMVGNTSNTNKRLCFLYYPQTFGYTVRRYADWQDLITRKPNAGNTDANYLKLIRQKGSDGLYSYSVYINDFLCHTYTDTEGLVGDNVTYYMGTVGCKGTLSGWYYKKL